MARTTTAQRTPSHPPPRLPHRQQHRQEQRRRRRGQIIALRTSSRLGVQRGRSSIPRRHTTPTTRRQRNARTCCSSCTPSRGSTHARTARTTSARACAIARRTCARTQHYPRGFARRTTRSTLCSASPRLTVRAWMSGGGMDPAMGAAIRAWAGPDFVYSI